MYSCQHSDTDRMTLALSLVLCHFADIPKPISSNLPLITNSTITLYTPAMKLASVIVFSSSLLGMASAGYLIKSVPAKVVPRVKPRSPINGKPGCDNSQCPPPPDMGCLTSTRHSIECGNGNDECWIIPRDCASLCRCEFYNPYNDLLDSCARGVPGTDSYECVCLFDCDPLGPKSGNGQCTADQDACKRS
ncbi:hypothetical protein COCVIDRAFT_42464 [Bipolaris victoriae FI3]|uniref:Uncharacterized protein n=1 Tax=Bipolaris victoriae (strain FI3) TaxID=930091 RepID=W7DZR4_BIPV3|nr:hypothetical protein COCVIDRAFT_42464 [Bipolaris victoriae FI3]